ncbi:MAG TPA: enoyl-CoA hydratase-related protein [Candidatus Acidoferrales bacterium]
MAPEIIYASIKVACLGPVCSIELHKPPLNIIDIAMMEEIQAALREADADPDVRVVAFRGAGPKAFCAGVSIQDHTPDRLGEMIPRFHGIFRQLARTDKVTLAVVDGHCLGGGFELAMMCDLVVASENAQFGQPEIKLGQLAPVGVILLPHLIGYRKAAELLLTGSNIDARQAQALGIVNRVVPAGQLSQCADELLRELLEQSGSALRLTKTILRRVAGLDFERALAESEEFFLQTLAQTDDAKEGIFAFLEKRAPQWTHR